MSKEEKEMMFWQKLNTKKSEGYSRGDMASWYEADTGRYCDSSIAYEYNSDDSDTSNKID